MLTHYPGSTSLNDKPAVSGNIRFHDKFVPEDDFYPWDAVWDHDMSLTAWGWVTCSLAPQAHFIFLSGAFIAWPTCWNRKPPVKSAAHQSILLLYLKITLYYELAYHLFFVIFVFQSNIDRILYFSISFIIWFTVKDRNWG